MRQHRTIYLNAIDQRRADRLAKRQAAATLLLATLASILALSGPCLILYATAPSPLPTYIRIGLAVAGCGAIIAAASIAAYMPKHPKH